MMPPALSKRAYGRHAGVDHSTISSWIRKGWITAPALRPDGLVDVAIADRQLAGREEARRSTLRSLQHPVVETAMVHAAAASVIFTAIERSFLLPAASALALTPSQVEQLGRQWYAFRARTRSG
jgi:hypothetical protein